MPIPGMGLPTNTLGNYPYNNPRGWSPSMPSSQMPGYAFNMPTAQGSQGPYAFNPPPIAPSGGGGWMSGIPGLAGAGSLIGGPLGAGIGAGLGLLGGLFGGIASGKKKKEAKKALEKGQREYQQKASQLFPELSKESFQYQNPQLNNAIQAALAYRLGNMFGTWGMPPEYRQNLGSLNEFFGAMMPQTAQASARPTPQRIPQRTPQGSGGGWYGDFRNRRAYAM